MSERPGTGPATGAPEDAAGEIDMVAYRARQRARANAMAIALVCLAVLFFLVTVAKMQIFG